MVVLAAHRLIRLTPAPTDLAVAVVVDGIQAEAIPPLRAAAASCASGGNYHENRADHPLSMPGPAGGCGGGLRALGRGARRENDIAMTPTAPTPAHSLTPADLERWLYRHHETAQHIVQAFGDGKPINTQFNCPPVCPVCGRCHTPACIVGGRIAGLGTSDGNCPPCPVCGLCHYPKCAGNGGMP